MSSVLSDLIIKSRYTGLNTRKDRESPVEPNRTMCLGPRKRVSANKSQISWIVVAVRNITMKSHGALVCIIIRSL